MKPRTKEMLNGFLLYAGLFIVVKIIIILIVINI